MPDPIPPQYAAIPDAYCFGELILNSPEGGPECGRTIFQLLGEALADGKITTAGALKLIREIATEDAPDSLPAAAAAKIAEQIDRPEWITYVAAGLGMM